MTTQIDNSKIVPERIQLWIDALRSGNYGQCRARLRGRDYMTNPLDPEAWEVEVPNNTFCCLGVLADVYINNADLSADEMDAAQHWLDNETLPHREMLDWFGLQVPPGLSPISGNIHVLTEQFPEDAVFISSLNDTFYWDFDQIADLIERQILPGGVIEVEN